VDVGLYYTELRKMQNAADAAALAGGQLLTEGASDGAILAAVQQYAAQNGAPSVQAFYKPSGQAVGSGLAGDSRGIAVTTQSSWSTVFAGVVGLSTMSVQAHAESKYQPLSIVLVMDRSGSMDDDSFCTRSSWMCGRDQASCESAWCGGTWAVQPLTAAKEAAKHFVDLNNPTLAKIGLVSYGNNATLDWHLTDTFIQVKWSIDGLDAGGCTNGSDAMFRARNELTGPRAVPDSHRIMVLLTDGKPNKPYCNDCRSNCPAAKAAMRTEAAVAANNNIEIYSIGLGDDVDMQLMRDLAAITGGRSFYAPSASDLDDVYQQVFDSLQLKLSA
jgi:Mg-chelatase subunit ChlD